ncbi:MAG TPA: hypothetical protein PJ988_19370 [Anaerolinea sp.]|nr:hypothetical protein [Anaerolinea sp.]
MKRTDFLPLLIAGLVAVLGGVLVRASFRQNLFSKVQDGSWWMILLLLVAGISLVVFLTYAFASVNSAALAVI